MAKRPDTSSVSQEEVEALFQHNDLYETEEKSGEDESPEADAEASTEDEEEQSQDEEEAEAGEPEAEEQEEEPEEEEAAASDEEDDEEESEPEQLDWSKVGKQYREAHEKAAAEANKWQKAHSKLQSQLTRESRARQQEESTLEELRADAQEARQWNQLLAKHPELEQVLEKEIRKLRDPFKDVPEYLQKDPVFQQMQRFNQQLEQRLAAFESRLEPVKDIQTERAEAKNRERLNGLLGEANEKFKSMFGKDMGKSEERAVLEYMVKNKYYLSGKNVVVEVFSGQYEKNLAAKRTEALKAKAKKFGGRTRSAPPNRSSKMSQDAGSVDEAIARALADQGYGT